MVSACLSCRTRVQNHLARGYRSSVLAGFLSGMQHQVTGGVTVPNLSPPALAKATGLVRSTPAQSTLLPWPGCGDGVCWGREHEFLMTYVVAPDGSMPIPIEYVATDASCHAPSTRFAGIMARSILGESNSSAPHTLSALVRSIPMLASLAKLPFACLVGLSSTETSPCVHIASSATARIATARPVSNGAFVPVLVSPICPNAPSYHENIGSAYHW